MLWLSELAARRRAALVSLTAAALGAGAALVAAVQACYSTGDGTPPPPNTFYFPVGLAVSKGGNVLYVVNSDFDLQWNGGTIQSYDLNAIRRDAAISAAGYALSPQLPFPEGGGLREFLDGGTSAAAGAASSPEAVRVLPGRRWLRPLPMVRPFIDSTFYERDSVTIGAFATDIQMSPWGNRLYVPVRGDASLTWLTGSDDLDGPAMPNQLACDADGGMSNCYAPFTLQCGQAANGGRCDATHHAGVNPFEPGNTRNLTMPGEPFAMAQTADGTAIVLTHQSEGDTSLFLTGLTPDGGSASPSTPSMQFIDAGLPLGGDGIAEIPHDPGSVQRLERGGRPGSFPNPAFLETNNTAAQLNLIRYYRDDRHHGPVTVDAAVARREPPVRHEQPSSVPYIEVERTLAITSLSSGTNSRGIAFDTSAPPRSCEHRYLRVSEQTLRSQRRAAPGTPARLPSSPTAPLRRSWSGLRRRVHRSCDPGALQRFTASRSRSSAHAGRDSGRRPVARLRRPHHRRGR